MLKLRRLVLALPALVGFLALAGMPGPARADLQLMMFEQAGCPWCARWNADVAPAYPKTPEGAAAPLTRIDIHASLPAGITLKRPPQFTPTFVLLQDGTEVGRIEGYPGQDFFWGLLDRMLSGVDAKPAAVTTITEHKA